MTLDQVLTAAPPTPACFPDRLQWAQVLHGDQRHTKARVLPFRNGIYQPAYNYCRNCTAAHESVMATAGKCHPNKYRATAPVTEAA